MFHHYHQNNSGGYFTGDFKNLFVEADTCEEADFLAEQEGVYFDSSRDCSCCGSRWDRCFQDHYTLEEVMEMLEKRDFYSEDAKVLRKKNDGLAKEE